MSIKRVVRLPWRWWGAAGVALVTVLAVVGAYVEANPAHRYGGLHLTSHPPLAPEPPGSPASHPDSPR